MYRFVAFVWNPADHEASELAARLRESLAIPWRIAVERRGLSVSYTGRDEVAWQLHHLAGDGGVILGALFESSLQEGRSMRSASQLDAGASRAILSSHGAYLIEHHWGRYVAFLYNEDTQTQVVLRDPTGHVPCFFVRHSSVWIYFSWLPDVLALGVCPQIDWRYVLARLKYRAINCEHTGLTDVFQLISGQCAEHQGDRHRTMMHWDPQAIAQRRVFADPAQAATELARVTRNVVRTWADSYSSVLLALSGGLDSSILLASCDGSPARIVCFNEFTKGTAGDERHFARRAARRARRELLEMPLGFDLQLSLLEHCAPHPEPINCMAWLSRARFEAPLAREHGMQAILSGDGGDEIFLRWGSLWAVVDFVRDNGLGMGAFSCAMAAARMEGASVWAMLQAAASGRGWSPRSELLGGVVVEALLSPEDEERFVHPAFVTASTSAGKCRHAYLISTLVKQYDPVGMGESVDAIAPLCSQPLMELCLRIPTYLLMERGWDRALARRAFKKYVPRRIIARRIKGDTSEWVREITAKNATLLRSFLLEGQLVKHCIVDPNRIGKALSPDRPRGRDTLSDIYDLLNVEIWLHSFAAATRPTSSLPPQVSPVTFEHLQ